MIGAHFNRLRNLAGFGFRFRSPGGTEDTALREAEQRLRDFIDAASDWFWEMDRDFRFTFFSDRRYEATGQGPESALGKTRWEIAGVDPDHDDLWREHRDVLRAHRPFRDFRYVFEDRVNGRRLHWKVSGKPVFDDGGTFTGYRGTCTDITAEVEAETRAEAARKLLAEAIEAMPGGLAIYDKDDRLVMANRHYLAPTAAIDGTIRLGMQFEEVVRAAAANRFYASNDDDAEDAIRRRLDRHRNPQGPFEQQLGTGEWVMFNEFRLPNGSTTVLRLDITEMKKARDQAAEAHTRLIDAIESIPASFILYGPDEKMSLWNSKTPNFFPEVAEHLAVGTSAEELTRARYRQTMIGATDREIEAQVAERMKVFRHPGSPIIERLPDGRWTQARECRMSDGSTVCIRNDISDRIQIEEELRESRRLLQAVIDAVPAMINAKDAESRYILINKFQADLYGTTPAAAYGKTAADFVGADHGRYSASLDRTIFESGQPIPYYEQTYDDPRGITHTWLTTKVPLKTASGEVRGIVSAALDITDRKRAERALQESEQRFRDVADSAGDWIWEMDADLRFTYLSPRFYELFSIAPTRILGKTRAEFAGVTTDDESWLRHLTDLAAHRAFRNFQYTVHDPSDGVRYIRISGKPVFDGEGRFLGYRGTGTDSTAEVKAAASARRTEIHLLEAIESIPAGFALFDADDRLVLCNSRFKGRIPGREHLTRPGMTFEEIIRASAGHGTFQIKPGQTMEEVLQDRIKHHVNRPSSHDRQLPDGRWIRIDEFPTHDGGAVLLRTDITSQRLLERQLVEAQRMEAIGQLTGGVAHDFNNLLSVVLGNLKLLDRRMGRDEALQKHLRLATKAGERGAELVRRLLAFSRRQVLESEYIDVNELIRDMEPLLRRTLGETISIEINLVENPWTTRVDPSQLENALLNLVLNARDAMESGGRLTIETANTVLDAEYAAHNREVIPGEYVMIAVADTGGGVRPEHLARIFEPFFTTKEVGKGTGLGLSMVYGFVKQSGGHIKAYSEVSIGTTMKLYLRGTSTAAVAERKTAAAAAPMATGSETVLVVEDDEDVRETAVTLLKDLGYPVLEAASGWEALDILTQRSDIDLLFTDIVLPYGLRGPELAQEAQKVRPGLKVVYTSGYTENGAFAAGVMDRGAAFVGKPLRLEELATKIRRILDRPEKET